MTSRNKIQMDIFKAILGDSNCLHMFELGNENVGITTDGYIVNILAKSQIAFSLERFKNNDGIEVFEELETDVVLRRTNRLFKTQGGRYTVAELDGGEFKTYVDTAKLNKFDGCTLKANSSISRVLAYDSFGMVGLFLPVRYEPKAD